MLLCRGNLIERNRESGLFIDEDVRHGSITDNILTGNRRYGIGGLERPAATTMVISANHCLNNHLGAIEFTGHAEAVQANLMQTPVARNPLHRRMF